MGKRGRKVACARNWTETNDIPIVYLYEVNLDDERLALRAIEVFENRQLIKIDDLYRGVIEVLPIPTADEFNTKIWGEGFRAFVISRDRIEVPDTYLC